MQTSMHFHAVFCLARAAGLPVESAQRIAFGSEFVDHLEHPSQVSVTFKDGQTLAYFPTLLPALDAPFCYTQSKCWNSWVPFHFLPGCDIGAEHLLVPDATREHRAAICHKNSPIATTMMTNAIARNAAHWSEKEVALADIGIGVALHVFADTYSHDGFSGLQSHFNDCRVIPTNPLLIKMTIIEHFDKDEQRSLSATMDDVKTVLTNDVKELFSEEGIDDLKARDLLTRMSCGHAQALTLPDIPYLKYTLSWLHPVNRGGEPTMARNNRKSFVNACMEIFRYLQIYNTRTLKTDPYISEEDLRKVVTHLIKTEISPTKREELWISAYEAGHFTCAQDVASLQAEFPDFDALMAQFTSDLAGAPTMTKAAFLETNTGRFITATEEHRDAVLNRLIPEPYRFYPYWRDEKSFANDMVLTDKNKEEFIKELQSITQKAHEPHY